MSARDLAQVFGRFTHELKSKKVRFFFIGPDGLGDYYLFIPNTLYTFYFLEFHAHSNKDNYLDLSIYCRKDARSNKDWIREPLISYDENKKETYNAGGDIQLWETLGIIENNFKKRKIKLKWSIIFSVNLENTKAKDEIAVCLKEALNPNSLKLIKQWGAS